MIMKIVAIMAIVLVGLAVSVLAAYYVPEEGKYVPEEGKVSAMKRQDTYDLMTSCVVDAKAIWRANVSWGGNMQQHETGVAIIAAEIYRSRVNK